MAFRFRNFIKDTVLKKYHASIELDIEWVFDTEEEAREEIKKFGYKEPIPGRFCLTEESKYKPVFLKIEEITNE